MGKNLKLEQTNEEGPDMFPKSQRVQFCFVVGDGVRDRLETKCARHKEMGEEQEKR